MKNIIYLYRKPIITGAALLVAFFVVMQVIRSKRKKTVLKKVEETGLRFLPILFPTRVRKEDAHGAGHYGASRSSGLRSHKGVDLVAAVNQDVFSPFSGQITKINQVYSGDSRYRGLTIEGSGAWQGIRAKLFYVNSLLKKGDVVESGDVIGNVQDLGVKYPGITIHVH